MTCKSDQNEDTHVLWLKLFGLKLRGDDGATRGTEPPNRLPFTIPLQPPPPAGRVASAAPAPPPPQQPSAEIDGPLSLDCSDLGR